MRWTYPIAALALCLSAAQEDPPGWQTSQQAEVLRLMQAGQFAQVQKVVPELLAKANVASSAVGYRAALHQLWGAAANQLGQYREAEAKLEEGVKLIDSSATTAPQVLIPLLVSLGEARLNQNRPKQAEADLRRAFAIADTHLAPDHPRVAAIWDGLGLVHWARGQQGKAEAAFRQALAILEKNYGPAHPDVNAEVSSLATALVQMGRPAEALPLLRRSLNALEANLGASHPETIRSDYALGIALKETDPAEAEQVLRDGLAKWHRASLPQVHPTVIMFHNALAAVRFKQGAVQEAIGINETALALIRQLLGPEHPQVVVQMVEHARLLQVAKRKKEATALKREADRIRVAHGYPEPGRHTIDIRALQRGR